MYHLRGMVGSLVCWFRGILFYGGPSWGHGRVLNVGPRGMTGSRGVSKREMEISLIHRLGRMNPQVPIATGPVPCPNPPRGGWQIGPYRRGTGWAMRWADHTTSTRTYRTRAGCLRVCRGKY